MPILRHARQTFHRSPSGFLYQETTVEPPPKPINRVIRPEGEPSIYRWVTGWAKGVIICSLLGLVSGTLYIISDWMTTYGNICAMREKVSRLSDPTAPAYGHEERMELREAEATYELARRSFETQIASLSFATLLFVLVGGCALILVDIGRSVRKPDNLKPSDYPQ